MIRLLLPILLVAAGPAGAASLTLEDALARAEAANPGLGAGAARVEAARLEAVAVARQSGFRLRAEAAAGVTDQPSHVFAAKLDAGEFTAADFAIDSLNDPDVLAQLQGSVVAERPLDLFGKVKAAAARQGELARAADAEWSEGRLDLRLAVVETFRRTLVAERAVAVAERALAAARSREAELGEQVGQGLALPADALRVRVRRREREADLAARRLDVQVARVGLERLLGEPIGAEVELVPPVSHSAADFPEANWLTRALADRPLVKSAAARATAAGWRKTSEERDAKPDLALWARAQLQRADFAGGELAGGAGVSLRWSLIDPGRAERLAAVDAAERGAALEVRAAEDRVRFEIASALRRLEAARERAQAAAGGAEEGREVLRVIQERRRAGLATLTDELETESVALAAEIRELEAATEVALAEAALLRAAGAL